jgi:rubrerythrin
MMKVKEHKLLAELLQKAYSAEKAAAFAYQGHAGSVKNTAEKKAIRQIEIDEWNHRTEVLKLMKKYEIPISKQNEIRFHIVGKSISLSCYIIGWFMPFYFAGNLESGNVCEYIRIKRLFNELNIYEHDEILCEMSIKEKQHEVYFYDKIKDNKLLPFFEKFFKWGNQSKNDIQLEDGFDIEHANDYCKHYGEKEFTEKKELENIEI